MLAHPAAVLGEDQAEAQHVLVRRAVEDQRADRHQRVEPAARLVESLADELRRVGGLERLGTARQVRVSPLRERHRPGVVPGIDDVGLPPHRPVPVRAPKVTSSTKGRCGSSSDRSWPGELGELGQRADADQMVGFGLASPDRQRRAPVPVAGQRPVDVVSQPLAVAAPLDRLGVPGRSLVLPQECVLDRRRPDVPGRLCVVEQRRVAAPAMRVGVLVGRCAGAADRGASRSFTRAASACLKNCPPTRGTSSANVPSGRIGLTTGRP